jgi:hypothetical protein
MAISEEWKQKIEDYEKSGLLQKEWCRVQGISSGTFQYHLKQIRESRQQNKFRELPLQSKGLKLYWKTLCIEIDTEFDEETLERLLRTLAQLS